MRILCIHGLAINSHVFQARTEKLRALLPEDYSYEWLDGRYHVKPLDIFYDYHSGPYLSHTDGLTTDEVHGALSRLQDYIRDNGPFDGVMGSCEVRNCAPPTTRTNVSVRQGSWLAASLLLKHQMEDPTSPLPFQFAIFISGSLPLSWSSSIGHDYLGVLTCEDPLSTDPSLWQRKGRDAKLEMERLSEIQQRLKRDISPEGEIRLRKALDLVADPANSHLRPRAFHPDLHQDRLNLPTAHIWGREDFISGHAKQLLRLCNSAFAEVFEHKGGHDVPQSREDSTRMSEVIQKTIVRSQFAI
ncbi:hypothetical protein G6O67_006195 [Ophiocordyceps sinensis]|uniref:Serine hydrolase domain-containing protein n=1 Tax=Ophiocordyceps sinensis TaxID=72228 RepID=A0A8H4LUY2_9HYPO|nr:hypothetical protein G6O67_006195 [Ophiocordyceps sinensis]